MKLGGKQHPVVKWTKILVIFGWFLSILEEEEPWKEVASSNGRGRSEIIRHPFSFSSVYSLDRDNREITSNHSRTNCMVDYIYYSSSSNWPSVKTRGGLELLSTLRLFTDDEATAMGGLPNRIWSSDHFSLMACFSLNWSKLDLESRWKRLTHTDRPNIFYRTDSQIVWSSNQFSLVC